MTREKKTGTNPEPRDGKTTVKCSEIGATSTQEIPEGAKTDPEKLLFHVFFKVRF